MIFDVPEMPNVLPSKQEILDVFYSSSSNMTQLSAAWSNFRIQYLKAMSEISQRLFFTDPMTGDQHMLSDIFSANEQLRTTARGEIAEISKLAEGFAAEIIAAARASFAGRFSVTERALFMAQLSIVEEVRQDAIELGESLDPASGSSSADLRQAVWDFQSGWMKASNPALWTQTVLDGMRSYISQQKGFWDRLLKPIRLWKLGQVKIERKGNLKPAPFDRMMLIYNSLDHVFTEAIGRGFLGSKKIRITWDGKNRSLILYSMDNAFARLQRNADFGKLIRQLGGTLEQPFIAVRVFRPWRRWRIPLDSPQGPGSTASLPPLPYLPAGSGGSEAGTASGNGAGTSSAMAITAAAGPITAAYDPITAYVPNMGSAAASEELPEQDVADGFGLGLDEFLGVPDALSLGEACFAIP